MPANKTSFSGFRMLFIPCSLCGGCRAFRRKSCHPSGGGKALQGVCSSVLHAVGRLRAAWHDSGRMYRLGCTVLEATQKVDGVRPFEASENKSNEMANKGCRCNGLIGQCPQGFQIHLALADLWFGGCLRLHRYVTAGPCTRTCYNRAM